MNSRFNNVQRLVIPVLALAVTFGVATAAAQQEIGFVEQFALSSDREKELEKLVPGTDDYYYFHCLHFLNTGRFDQCDSMMEQWEERHGANGRYVIIRNRLALLGYDTDPEKTISYLKTRLNVNLNHQREIPQAQRDLEVDLDPALLDEERLIRDSLRRDRDLGDIEDSLLEALADRNLSAEQRRILLNRIAHPDYPGLVDLIATELRERETTNFGRFSCHRLLTLAQLEELAGKVPALKVDNSFVNIWLGKLVPGEDVDWRSDQAEHRAYLERLKAYVMPLAPKFNSLKACVLYRLLDADRNEEVFDHDLFMEYLKLPRSVGYINPEFIRSIRQSDHIANLNLDFQQQIMLAPVYDDTQLVAEFLQHFLAEAASDRAYRRYVESEFLSRQMAIGKILRGLGDTEKLASVLSPQEYQDLLNRVDLYFAKTNKQFYGLEEAVNIELYTKNIESLIVKVFEINTNNFYRREMREIDTDINLDGLVPNQEMRFEYDDAPALRIKRNFEIPGLDEAGVYIVDFIAGGQSSRALIRKGRLFLIEQTTVAGHVLRVADQDGELISDANVLVSGRRYDANEDGLIAIPFTDSPRFQPVIVSSGDFSCLEAFQHRSENYGLSAAMMLDRESLLRSNEARMLIRPQLTVAGIPAGTGLLEDVVVTITSTDHEGHASTRTVKDLELTTDAETECTFVVPPRLSTVSVELTASVKNISASTTQKLSVSRSWTINQIDKSDEIQDLHLIPHDLGYSLEVLGKSGEVRAGQAVRLSIKVRGIRRPLTADLQSAGDGLINLGELNGVETLTANLVGGSSRTWHLNRTRQTIDRTIHASPDDVVEIPAPASVSDGGRDQLSLYEVRNSQIINDQFDNISVEDGLISVSGLAPGDYVLRIKPLNRSITIRITEGTSVAGMLHGGFRNLEVRGGTPVHFQEGGIGDDDIVIKVGNANEWTRVHIVAGRYKPRFDAYAQLAPIRDVTPGMQRNAVRRSVYLAGRSIGDEYQYILDRRNHTVFPGNMLDRPGLLVSPWAVRDTDNNQEVLQSGNDYGIAGNEQQSTSERDAADGEQGAQSSDFANLDFLRDASLISINVRPDENGLVRISREDIGDRQHIQVVLADAY
ncbi:MAG: hypothetical protein AAF456_23185, partial [Planctomycetota bacterium]